MTWLDKFMEATRDSEAPEVYFKWAGLSVISAIAKNNVFLDRHHYILYPNIYVMLIGRSGLRKGIPILYAKKLVESINNTRIIAGRNSIEAIVRELSVAQTSEGGGDIIKDAVGYMISSEFAAFLVRNPDALTILTDLYDGHYNTEWRNSLKGTGVEKLHNVCLTLLGASNEIHFKDTVPLNAIGGGFIARTTLAVSKEKRGSNSLTEKPEHEIDVALLAEELKPILKLKGKFAYTKGGKDAYDKWYYAFDKKVITDTTGTAERLGDHVLKVAMLLSLSRGTSLLINESDIENAVEACENATKGTQEVFLGHGEQSLVKPTTAFLKELLKVYPEGMGRSEVLKKLWGTLDSIELDRIVDTTKQAGFIDTECPGGHWKYYLKEKAYKQILQFTEGKK